MAESRIDNDDRDRLIRVETCLQEQTRRMQDLLEISKSLVKLQERESVRDGKIDAILTKLHIHENEIYKLNKVKNWGVGAICIIMAIVVPMFSYGLKSTYTLISSVDRRVVRVESRLNLPSSMRHYDE